MFFSLVDIEVGGHLYWNIAGLIFHEKVLIILCVGIILSICFRIGRFTNSFGRTVKDAELLLKKSRVLLSISFYVGFITKIDKTTSRYSSDRDFLYLFSFQIDWLIPRKFLHFLQVFLL